MKKIVPIHKCSYVSLTEIVPKNWENWFYEQISDNAPFSWGDNNHTLIDITFFMQHCEERLDDSPKVKRWLREVRKLDKDLYIDLET